MYNADNSIERCLASVLQDATADIEVLCVDDGSVDSTVDKVETIAQADKRVKLLKLNHTGVSAARNAGLCEITGEFVAFVDADDALTYGAVTKIDALLREHKCDCLTFGGYAAGNSERAKVITANLQLPDALYTDTDITEKALFDVPSCDLFVWNKVFSSKLIKDNNILFDANILLGEDRIFVFECMLHSNKLVSTSDKLYIYTADSNNSITKTYVNQHFVKSEIHLTVVDRIFAICSKQERVSALATYRLLNWAASYVYRPRKEQYLPQQKAAIITAFEQSVKRHYPQATLTVTNEGIVVHI